MEERKGTPSFQEGTLHSRDKRWESLALVNTKLGDPSSRNLAGYFSLLFVQPSNGWTCGLQELILWQINTSEVIYRHEDRFCGNMVKVSRDCEW